MYLLYHKRTQSMDNKSIFHLCWNFSANKLCVSLNLKSQTVTGVVQGGACLFTTILIS